MDLTTFNEPARIWKQGEQIIAEVVHPAKVKVQITGPGAQTLLDEGPPAGWKWTVVTVRVEAREVTA